MIDVNMFRARIEQYVRVNLLREGYAVEPVTEQAVIEQWHDTLRDGTSVLIRPINAGDIDRERAFIEGLSPESRRFRFFNDIHHPTPEFLRQLVGVDQIRDVAFVALVDSDGAPQQIGVGRYCTDDDGKSCECAIVVSDQYNNRGVGTLLLNHLIDTARKRGIRRMYSLDLTDNYKIQELAKRMGFHSKIDPSDSTQVIHYRDIAD